MNELGGADRLWRSIVVLEPSCASVFRDELRSLFPSDARATRLRGQTLPPVRLPRNLGPPDFSCLRLSKKVLLHGHCHHKALMTTKAEEALLRKMGTTLEAPDTGCCGMAGAFGFEADKFAVSQAIGERVLLPASMPGGRRYVNRVGRVQLSQSRSIRLPGGAPFTLAEVIKLGLNTTYD